MNKNVNKHVEDLLKRFPELECITENLYTIYCTLQNSFFNSNTFFVCGNGGSSCDGEHIVGELMKSFRIKRKMPDQLSERFEQILGKEENIADKLQMGFRAISLNNHPGLSSAYINDVDPLMVYAQQIFVMGREGDVLMGLSTSGNAVNVYNAFKAAKVMGIRTILLTGEKCGICEKYADILLKVPSSETYIIQEYHLPVYHTLCSMIEEGFYGTK